MEIYNYDENGLFTVESIADASPLEENGFLIPANATTVKPLEFKEGFDIKFDGVNWEYIETEQEDATAKPKLVELTEAEIKSQEALALLNSTDWKVIRELERMFLNGTELNLSREALRREIA